MVSVAFTTVFVCALALATAPLSRLFTWQIVPFAVARDSWPRASPGWLTSSAWIAWASRGRCRWSSSSPAFAVLVAIAALGERPSPLLLVAVACIAAGGALVVARDRAATAWRPLDMAFPLLAALGFAVRDNIFRYGFRQYEEPLLAAAVAAVASVVVMGLVGALGFGAGRVEVRSRALLLLAASGFAEALAYVTALRAFRAGDVSIVSPLVNTHGLFAVVLAAIFLRDLERVTWRLVLATLLILAGIAVVVRATPDDAACRATAERADENARARVAPRRDARARDSPFRQ